MPSQAAIIRSVNSCLSRHKGCNFRLNSSGVCAGLSALYVKYYLEGNTRYFFDMLEKLAALDEGYEIGDDHYIDKFIINIEELHNQYKYSNYQVWQAGVDHLFRINGSPISNEYNLGMITTESEWTQILHDVASEGRAYLFGSHNHATALSYENGKFTMYDPNYPGDVRTFNDACDVVKEMKEFYGYAGNGLGLGIRVFAHPQAAAGSAYPDKAKFYPQLIPSINEGNNKYTSLSHAVSEKDDETIRHLFKNNGVDLDAISPRQITNSEVARKMLENAISKPSLLKYISCAIHVNDTELLNNLIVKYNTDYSADQDKANLRTQLAYASSYASQFGKISDYSALLKMLKDNDLDEVEPTKASYQLLSLLTAIEDGAAAEKLAEWKKLEASQLRDQLKLALRHCGKRVLSLLVEQGFSFDEKDLGIIIERNDKEIFEIYKKTQPQLMAIEAEDVDLSLEASGFRYLDVLIFMGENIKIRGAWSSASLLAEDNLRLSLYYAYLCDNDEIIAFLQDEKQIKLDDDLLRNLLQHAIDTNQFTIIDRLSCSYNLLFDKALTKKLTGKCSLFSHFTPLCNTCEKATDTQIRNLLDIVVDGYESKELIQYLAGNKRALLINYVNEKINQEKLAGLNRIAMCLGKEANDFILEKLTSDACVNHIVASISKNNFHLAHYMEKIVTIPDEKLKELFLELINKKNQSALIYLLKNYKQLLQDQSLIDVLYENKCFRVIEKVVLEEKINIDDAMVYKLLELAIARKDEAHLRLIIIQYPHLLNEHASSILEVAIDNKFVEVARLLVQNPVISKVDAKAFFIRACHQQLMAVAEGLLEVGINFEPDEIKLHLQALFSREMSPQAIFEKLYCAGHRQLYTLAVRHSPVKPRRIDLMDLIKTISIRSKSNDNWNATSIRNLMEDNWESAALILQLMPKDDPVLNDDLKEFINDNASNIIVKGLLKNCNDKIGEEDCREKLFSLLTGGCNNALALVAEKQGALINEGLIALENKMINKKIPLGNKCYRHFDKNRVEPTPNKWRDDRFAINEGINEYLENRPTTLGFFSRCFDSTRGAVRAHHYLELLKQCSSELHFSVIAYALLASEDGVTLKESVATALGYDDYQVARAALAVCLKGLISNNSAIKTLDDLNSVVGQIVEKANSDNNINTDVLFMSELQAIGLRQ